MMWDLQELNQAINLPKLSVRAEPRPTFPSGGGGGTHALGRETCRWMVPPRGSAGPEPGRLEAGPGLDTLPAGLNAPLLPGKASQLSPSEQLHPGHALPPPPPAAPPEPCYFKTSVKPSLPVSHWLRSPTTRTSNPKPRLGLSSHSGLSTVSHKCADPGGAAVLHRLPPMPWLGGDSTDVSS